MGKVIQLKPRRRPIRLEVRDRAGGECENCGHKLNVHITHPDGSVSCAARACGCHRPPTGEWPKA